MSTQSAKNNRVSWQTMQGISVFIFFILRPDIDSVFTLIALSTMLICLGISPLYVKNKPTSVFAASMIILALGCGIGGLTIGTLIERLFVETPTEIGNSWVAGVALICSSLGVLAWTFVVVKISPLNRPPLIAIVLFALAGVYSLILGILSVKTVLFDQTQITLTWGEGIAHILNGGAMVGWTHLVTRKTSITNRKVFVICLMIAGVGIVAVGITHILDAIF